MYSLGPQLESGTPGRLSKTLGSATTLPPTRFTPARLTSVARSLIPAAPKEGSPPPIR